MCLTRSKDWKIDGGNPSGGRRCVSRARFRIADMGRMVFDKRNPRPLIFVQKKSSIKKRNMASVDFKGANMGNFLKSEGVSTKSHFTTFLGFWEGRRLTEVDRSTTSSEVVRVVPLLLSSSWQEADWGWQINRVTSGIGVRGQLSASHLDVSKLHYFRIHPPTIFLALLCVEAMGHDCLSATCSQRKTIFGSHEMHQRRSLLALATAARTWVSEFLGCLLTFESVLKLWKSLFACLHPLSPHLRIICHYASSRVLLSHCSVVTGSVSWPTPSVWTSHTTHATLRQMDWTHTVFNKEFKHKTRG